MTKRLSRSLRNARIIWCYEQVGKPRTDFCWGFRAVQPKVLVCLGASAAQALFGRDFKVSQQRGEFVASNLAPYATATVHPSSILRAPDDQTRPRERQRFVQDLKKVAAQLTGEFAG